MPVVRASSTGPMDGRTQVISWVWAVSPLLTFGLATPVTFVFAAQRVRSAHYVIAAVVYTVMVLLGMVLPSDTVSAVLFTISWVAGTAHAVAVRSSVFRTVRQHAPPMQTALDAAVDRRELRRKARRIAVDDPGLARELGIGCPHLYRDFDDGGLIDVNRVPVEVFAHLPGMTAEMAERVVRVRDIRGAYRSAEELSVFADLPPVLTDRLAGYLLFLYE